MAHSTRVSLRPVMWEFVMQQTRKSIGLLLIVISAGGSGLLSTAAVYWPDSISRPDS